MVIFFFFSFLYSRRYECESAATNWIVLIRFCMYIKGGGGPINFQGVWHINWTKSFGMRQHHSRAAEKFCLIKDSKLGELMSESIVIKVATEIYIRREIIISWWWGSLSCGVRLRPERQNSNDSIGFFHSNRNAELLRIYFYRSTHTHTRKKKERNGLSFVSPGPLRCSFLYIHITHYLLFINFFLAANNSSEAQQEQQRHVPFFYFFFLLSRYVLDS